MELLLQPNTLIVALILATIVWAIHIHNKNKALREFEQKLAELTISDASHEQVVLHKDELIQRLEQEKRTLEAKVDDMHTLDSQQKMALAKLKTEFELEQKNSAEKLALLEDAKTKLANEFKVLANQIFEAKQSRMTESSKETLDAILKPVQKEISDFRSRIEQVHKEDTEARGSLERHLNHLKELNQKMSTEANNLTQALKGESKVQGNWGEMILEKILTSSGLREGKDFKREQSHTDEEGKRQRPDVIVYLPDNKHVIIDSKVSLTHYEQALSAKDSAAAQTATKLHLKSIKEHIITLATKRYDQISGLNSPDYTLMFIPIEAAYLMAIEVDSSVFEDAFSRNIAVVTPSTLYATLKLIEQLWRYEKQSDDVIKLIEHAGKLHDKVVGFITTFEEVGSRLKQAQNSYDTAFNQLSSGKGNVVSQINTLGKLSGKAKKQLPDHLTQTEGSPTPVTHEDGEEI